MKGKMMEKDGDFKGTHAIKGATPRACENNMANGKKACDRGTPQKTGKLGK